VRQRVLVALCAGACALLLPVLVAAPAAAADEVRVSADGRAWTSDLGRPLFDPAHRWVPGEERTETFWVRNDGEGPGTLRIGAVVRDLDGLDAGGWVDVSMRVDDGGWVALEPGERTARFGSMAQGTSEQVDVRAAFRPESGNDTMRQALEFDFEVFLAGDGLPDQPGASAGPDVPSTGGDRGDSTAEAGGPLLPDTGAPAGLGWLAALAALCLGAGIALLARRREREDT